MFRLEETKLQYRISDLLAHLSRNYDMGCVSINTDTVRIIQGVGVKHAGLL
jgi:hypothetical protein